MNGFEYAAPRSTADALALLSSAPGDTEILAGGTDLVSLLQRGVVQPRRVVSVMEIPELKVLEAQLDGSLVIGAAVTLDELLATPYLADYRAITDAILGINSMQLQCQGTIGGEICQRPQCWYFRSGRGMLSDEDRGAELGDSRYHAILGNAGRAKFVSSSRLAPALMALGAAVRILGPAAADERVVPLTDFFRTPQLAGERETILLPGQLLAQFILPPANGAHSATYEVRQSVGPDFPLAAAAAMLVLRGGLVESARIVLGQVAPTPWLADSAARLLLGRAVETRLAEQAAGMCVAAASPLADNQYKVQLAHVAVKRAILLAAGLATGGF